MAIAADSEPRKWAKAASECRIDPAPCPTLADGAGLLPSVNPTNPGETLPIFPYRSSVRDLIYILDGRDDLTSFDGIYRFDSSSCTETQSASVLSAVINSSLDQFEITYDSTDSTGFRQVSIAQVTPPTRTR